jgi:HTH-type transcriptional regulator / antitoxin HigA
MNERNEYFPSIVFHPGETLEEKLEEMGMGPKEFALRTGKPEKTIIAVLQGVSAITSDMAVQFENVTKIPAHFWLTLQINYDEFVAREKQQAIIEQAQIWAKQFPIAAMVQKGWLNLPPRANIQEKTKAMLSFFGFANHTCWEDYYFKQELKVAFRISLAHAKEPYAISAWLRKGELQAAELQTNAYSEKSFKASLPALKALMADHPAHFFAQLQDICRQAGVKVVHTPCLPKAPINGATRWLNDTPLIQLSGRHNRNDNFWFTFFHEAGHILLHGKKDVFLETDTHDFYTSSLDDSKKEQEANDFAVQWTLTHEEESVILRSQKRLTDELILIYAKQFRTHPAIIVGRLQRANAIRYSAGKNLVKPLDL